MKITSLLLILAAPALARADVVLDWNEVALATIQRTSASPPAAARALAMAHVAMYDAVNSVDYTRQPFRVYAPDSPDTSQDAAAAQAAFRVLRGLYPRERVRLESELAKSLAKIPDGPHKSAGIRLGELVGERIIAWRKGDGSRRAASHAAGSKPGEWRPTSPDFRPALLPQWGSVTPFGVPSASQFRPEPPPELGSAEYARDLEEVRTLGAADSGDRTADQTEIARYWADGAGTVTPPGHWNQIAQSVARKEGLAMRKNARLFALLNVALADAAIVCWDTKFACNLWRPITAIQEADTDGNDRTQADPAWRPLLDTPPFPSCSSGHSTFSGAAAQMLALFFGRDDVSFNATSDDDAITRAYTSFSQAAAEAGRSRVYAGIHFEFDNRTGLESGRAVSQHIFNQLMRPLASSPDNRLAASDDGRASAGRTSTYFRGGADGSFAESYSDSGGAVYGSSDYGLRTSYYLPRATYLGPSVPFGDAVVVESAPPPGYCQPIVREHVPIGAIPQPAVTYYRYWDW